MGKGDMHKCVKAVLILIALLSAPETCFSVEANQEQLAIDQYVKINSDSGWGGGLDVLVFDRKQFLGNRNESFFQNVDGNETEARKIGDIVFSPTQRIYIIETGWFVRYLEIRDASNDALLLGELGDNSKITLLFNGWGALYVKTRPSTICGGVGTATQKYQLVKGKLKEVAQPLLYWEDTTTELIADLVLHSEQDMKSPPVAKLSRGTKVQVLTGVKGWYLIKTPLGLTGWISQSPNPFPRCD